MTKTKIKPILPAVSEIKPKDPNAQYKGVEPIFNAQPEEAARSLALVKAFNWYNYFCDIKDAKEFIATYLEHQGKPAESKLMRKVPDNAIIVTTGWLARCCLRGYKLVEKQEEYMTAEIARLLLLTKKDDPAVEEEAVSGRPNVQEIMRERALEAGGELEGYFDDYLSRGAKKEGKIYAMSELTKRSILPQHIPMLLAPWQVRLTEFNEVLKGKDEQLNEAYARFTKHQIKSIVDYIERLISELNSYVSVKKAGRKPRAKKAISPEKKVAKLKYLKTFKDPELKLDLNSINPTALLNASEAWVYDTKRRKLHHYVADEYSRVFGVKGNLLLGFSTKESEIKALRKPAEQLKEIMGSKPAARKFFKDIRAMSHTPKGKFNKDMILLKAF